MSTTRPFSTISYNTLGFLKSKLDDCMDSNALLYYGFIKHIGETDPSGIVEKAHFHVFCMPNRKFDLASFRKEFEEPVYGSSIPLKCMPFQLSKADEWLLYVLHDREYLASKGLIKQYSYSLSEIHSSESQEFWEDLYLEARGRYVKKHLISASIASGATLSDLYNVGLVNSKNAFLALALVRDYGNASSKPSLQYNSQSIDADKVNFESFQDIPLPDDDSIPF